MYITAFTSISRTAFEIEALSSVFRSQWFAVNRFRKKTKEHSAQIIWDVENFKPRRNPVSYRKPRFLQAKSMNASEGKNFPSIEAIRSLRIFQAVPGTVLLNLYSARLCCIYSIDKLLQLLRVFLESDKVVFPWCFIHNRSKD